jgi:uncharacterized protein YqeY
MADTRAQVMDGLKLAMKAGDSARTSTLRMILARIKDADIAARPRGVEKVTDEEIGGLLRSMVKSRRESIALYEQGNRPDLVAKESAEIAVIEAFLPQALDDVATEAAVRDAIAETGATSVKDMGRVMAALKTRHGAALDMARAGPLVRAALAGG